MPRYIIIIFSFLVSFGSNAYCQNGAEYPAKRPHDWWQADWKKDSIPGISLDEAYNYLKGRKSKTVIVAIIDNCVDTAHDDLKNILWTNKKEIEGNGVDDDHNGYIDDVHGWCFVCGKNNQSQNEEFSSAALTYMTWEKKFENIDTNTLSGSLKIQYSLYRTSKNVLFEKYRLFSLLARV
jgi:cell wall-associated protease